MKRLFQSNGNGAHRKSAIDSDLLRILVPPVICVVICCTFFVGASWAWFTDSATCGVEDIKSSWGEQVNVTVTEMPAVSLMLAAEGESTEAEKETEQPTEWTLMSAVSLMLAAEGESTEAEEETEQPTEWTLKPDKGYSVTLQWPADENVQTEGYCVITIGSSQYRTEVFSDPLSFTCYTTGMEYPVVMKIDGFPGTYEATDGEEIIHDGGTIGKEPAPTPTPEATASPEPTPVPEATVSPEPTPTEDPTPTAAPTTEPAPETSVSPESTPTEDSTPTAAPRTEPGPETSVSPEPTATEAPTPTTENAEGQEQSEAQTSAPASQG